MPNALLYQQKVLVRSNTKNLEIQNTKVLYKIWGLSYTGC